MALEELDDNVPIAIVIPLVLKTMKNAFIYGFRVRFLHALAYQLATFKFKSPQTHHFKGIGLLLVDAITRLVKSVKMGLNHGKTLTGFAIVFRSILALLNSITIKTKSRVKLENHYIAGAVGGVVIYSGLINKLTLQSSKSKSQLIRTIGNILHFNEGILSQITMYTLSRLILAIGRDCSYELAEVINKFQITSQSSSEPKPPQMVDPQTIREVGWMVTCSMVWGGIMMYYRRDGDRKQNRKEYLQRALRISMDFIYGTIPYSWKEAFDYGGR